MTTTPSEPNNSPAPTLVDIEAFDLAPGDIFTADGRRVRVLRNIRMDAVTLDVHVSDVETGECRILSMPDAKVVYVEAAK